MTSPTVAVATETLSHQVAASTVTAEVLDISAGLRQQRLLVLSLTYRYMACIFWLGLATLWAIVVGLLYESVAITARLIGTE
jgi:hypothetical protein